MVNPRTIGTGRHLSTRPIPARNMILAMNPLVNSLPISSIQSQIGAVEVRIEGLQAQIAEVAESVKEVQRQVVGVGAKIEKTETALDAADLSSEKRVILVMKLKSQLDEKKSHMDKEKGLMDEKKILINKEGLMVKTFVVCARTGVRGRRIPPPSPRQGCRIERQNQRAAAVQRDGNQQVWRGAVHFRECRRRPLAWRSHMAETQREAEAR